jgi:[CysO sulfur-carrier protein]-S-L-cysteine hydrolase
VVSERLHLPASLARELFDHARAELPNEACGIIAGDLATGRATAFHPARNEEASPLRYTVHPDDLVRIVLGIEDAGQDLVGIFHSHTHTPAVPSPTDHRNALYPDAFYVLVTLAEPDTAPAALRAWRIRDGVSREVPVSIG